MSLLPCIFAQVYVDNAVTHWKNTSPVLREVIAVMLAGCAVGLIALLWAALVRKRKRTHRHHSHHHQNSPDSDSQTTSSPTSPEVSGNGHVRRKKRRRRRDHRPRNPTLAETGGLPPVRTDTPGKNAP